MLFRDYAASELVAGREGDDPAACFSLGKFIISLFINTIIVPQHLVQITRGMDETRSRAFFS